MQIDRLDHLVLTVADIERTCRFYVDVLQFERLDYARGRVALRFGRQKLNLHQVGRLHAPFALAPIPGSADLCFVSELPLAKVVWRLRQYEVPIELGPVDREGAMGPMSSVYFRDPDGNLIEVASYVDAETGAAN